MWFKALVILSAASVLDAETTAPGIDRSYSSTDNIKSMGYSVVYGDEDLAVINQELQHEDKWDELKADDEHGIAPLPAEDVKCLMSVDRYCSKAMRGVKSVLIQALKDDCAACSSAEKESAGRVVAAMMAHDPVAWKLFLTRYDSLSAVQRILGSALLILPKKKVPKVEKPVYKIVGRPEYVENTRNRYTMPGVKVRVKRYAMEVVR